MENVILTYGRRHGLPTVPSLLLSGANAQDITIVFHTLEDKQKALRYVTYEAEGVNCIVSNAPLGATSARNFILDNFEPPYIMWDDDITQIGIYNKNATAKPFYEFKYDQHMAVADYAMRYAMKSGASLVGIGAFDLEGKKPKRPGVKDRLFYAGMLGVIDRPPSPIPKWITHSEDCALQMSYLTAGKHTMRYDWAFLPLEDNQAVGGCGSLGHANFLRRTLDDLTSKYRMWETYGDIVLTHVGRDFFGGTYLEILLKTKRLEGEVVPLGYDYPTILAMLEWKTNALAHTMKTAKMSNTPRGKAR